MAWSIEYADAARKQMRKLDRVVARRIFRYLDERIAPMVDPRELGKSLSGPLGELWRYRLGDYRIITQLRHEVMTVLVLRVGHRPNVYKHEP